MRHLPAIALLACLTAGGLSATASASAAAEASSLQSSVWVAGTVQTGQSTVTHVFKPQRTGFYLVTLGDLSTDYSLSVRNAGGSTKAASDTATTGVFEEVVTKFTRGSKYKIQVGSKGVAGTYSLRALRLKSGVRTIDYNRVLAPSDSEYGSDLTMRVFNNTSEFQEIVSPPSFRFLDSAGRALTGSTMYNVVTPVLRPHSIGYIHLDNLPARWTTARRIEEVRSVATKDRPGSSSSVSVMVTSTDTPDFWDVTVTNETARQVWGYVNFLYFNHRGQLVNVADNDLRGTSGIFSLAPHDTETNLLNLSQATASPVSQVRTHVYITKD